MKNRSQVQEIFNFGLRALRKLWRILSFFLSLPIVFLLTLLFPFIKMKLVGLFSDRIGHYTVNTELLLCYLDQQSKNKKVKYLFYTREAPICNKQLHRMWKRIIPIFPFPTIAAYVDNCMIKIFRNRYRDDSIRKFEVSSGNEDMHGYLRKYPPHLFFISCELERGTKFLLTLGVPIGARFVCLLARDSAYLDKYLPGKDWSYHFYRDSNIENFAKAALFLANKGYYVIRMGKAVSKQLDVKHPNVIDYANLPLRSDFADVYLSSHCEFFISTSTGLDGIPEIFRKPVLFVNIPPFAGVLQYWYPGEFFIIKKIYDKKNDRFVSLKEVNDKIENVSDLRKLFDQLNWSIIENNEDEILDAVREIESYINQKVDRKKFNPFHSLLKTELPFSMLSSRALLRSCPEKFYIKMCDQFLEKSYSLISK